MRGNTTPTPIGKEEGNPEMKPFAAEIRSGQGGEVKTSTLGYEYQRPPSPPSMRGQGWGRDTKAEGA